MQEAKGSSRSHGKSGSVPLAGPSGHARSDIFRQRILRETARIPFREWATLAREILRECGNLIWRIRTLRSGRLYRSGMCLIPPSHDAPSQCPDIRKWKHAHTRDMLRFLASPQERGQRPHSILNPTPTRMDQEVFQAGWRMGAQAMCSLSRTDGSDTEHLAGDRLPS